MRIGYSIVNFGSEYDQEPPEYEEYDADCDDRFIEDWPQADDEDDGAWLALGIEPVGNYLD